MKDKKQILLYKLGDINEVDKAALNLAGYLPIPCNHPNDVVLLFPDGGRLKGDAIFQAALEAMSGSNSAPEREKFGAAIIRHLLDTPKA